MLQYSASLLPQAPMLTSTFTAFFLALTVMARPSHIVIDKIPISLSLAHHLNASGSVEKIADIDRARAKLIKSWRSTRPANHISKRGVWPVPLANTAVSYTVNVNENTLVSPLHYKVDMPVTGRHWHSSNQLSIRYFCGGNISPLIFNFADTLLVDTGSSLTWIGAGKAYNCTSSSQATNDTLVRATYIS